MKTKIIINAIIMVVAFTSSYIYIKHRIATAYNNGHLAGFNKGVDESFDTIQKILLIPDDTTKVLDFHLYTAKDTVCVYLRKKDLIK